MDRSESIKFVHQLLNLMAQKNASDMFITAGFAPALKVDGKITPVANQVLTSVMTADLARALMSDHQDAEFKMNKEANFAIAPVGIGRFRVNVYYQQGNVAMVLRTINSNVPTIDERGLPQILKTIALEKRGLVIFVGGTGSGKSTSLAAMVDHRNVSTHGHIITLEDPIEYVHPHKGCVISQREIGLDTNSWGEALKNTLRQAPDVILMGEIRDRETMDYALQFAETGHLCMATLHANNANQAIDRIINFFPEDRHQQVYMDLSLNVKALISQRLLPKKEGKGRVAAVEILINTPMIQDLIFKGEVAALKEAMKKSSEVGMQTFDQHLFALHDEEKITMEDALRNADSVNDLRLNIKLNSKLAKSKDMSSLLDTSLAIAPDKRR